MIGCELAPVRWSIRWFASAVPQYHTYIVRFSQAERVHSEMRS